MKIDNETTLRKYLKNNKETMQEYDVLNELTKEELITRNIIIEKHLDKIISTWISACFGLMLISIIIITLMI